MPHQTSIALPTFLLLFIIFPFLSHSLLPLPALHGYFTEEFYPFSGDLASKQNLADQWTVSGMIDPTAATTGDCNGWFMLGGLNTIGTGGYFQRTYTGLPTHNIVYYVIYFIVIDDWQATDSISIQFESGTAMPWLPLPAKTAFGRVLCGDMTGTNSKDVHYRVVGQYIHSANSLSLKIISGVSNGVTAGFGINYVQLSFHTDTTGQTQQQCTTYDGGNGVYGSTCTCSMGQYMGSSTCQTCDASCYHCWGATNYGCYACNTNYYWDGNRCLPAAMCPTGCYICSPDNLRCSVCLSTYALKWDYTCINPITCTSPYYIDYGGIYQFCRTPCQATNTFMFWNGNCTTTCNFPLQTRINGKAKFCDYPCSNTQYLHVNGTCATRCDYFLRTEDGNKFCDPCAQSGYYMNWIGECMEACPAPMVSRSEGQYMKCNNPCVNAGEYYYPKYGACKAGCGYPFKIKYAGFCVSDLTEDEESTLSEGVEDRKGLGYFMSAATILVSAANFVNPGGSLVFALMEILEYIRYMKVVYPPKLQYIFEHQESFGDLFSFLSGIPEGKFERYTLPGNFEYYQVHSKFFVNFWPDLLSLAITFGIIVIVLIMLNMLKKGTTFYAIFDKMKKSLKWNYFISIFATFYGNIVIMTSLELRTLHLNSFYSALSLITCFLVNILAVLIFVKTITLTKRVWDSRLPISPSRTPNQSHQNQLPPMVKTRWESYQVIYESYKLDSLLKLGFMPIFILKQYLFCFIIAYLFGNPMIQATLLVILNSLMVIYLVFKNPFKDPAELLEFLLQEILNTVICICVLILTIFDQGDMEEYDTRASVGDVIIVCSYISIGIAVVYLVFHLAIIGKDLYYIIKNYYIEAKKKAAVREALRLRNARVQPTPNDNLNTTTQMLPSPTMKSPPVKEEVQDLFRPKPAFENHNARLLTNGVTLTTTLELTRPVSENVSETVRPLDSKMDQSTFHLVNETALADSFSFGQDFYGLSNQRRGLPPGRYGTQTDTMFISDIASTEANTVRPLTNAASGSTTSLHNSVHQLHNPVEGTSIRKKRRL